MFLFSETTNFYKVVNQQMKHLLKTTTHRFVYLENRRSHSLLQKPNRDNQNYHTTITSTSRNPFDSIKKYEFFAKPTQRQSLPDSSPLPSLHEIIFEFSFDDENEGFGRKSKLHNTIRSFTSSCRISCYRGRKQSLILQ